MEALNEYLVPYITSQVISVIILIAAWKRTKLARVLFALIFFWASIINMYYGLQEPDIYLEYGELAIPLYRDFIYGWFSNYNHIIIPIIALGQMFIAVGMLLKGLFVKLACLGSILFLLSIAPLMVGSAFPFSITVSIAAYIIYKKDDLQYIRKRK